MSETGTTVPPALSPEEWKSGVCRVMPARHDTEADEMFVLGTGTGGRLGVQVTRTRDGRSLEVAPLLLAPVMAACNASLPDDHPGKIAREDVMALRALVRMGCTCGVITSEDMRAWDDAVERVPALVAKLAAILPPE